MIVESIKKCLIHNCRLFYKTNKMYVQFLSNNIFHDLL